MTAPSLIHAVSAAHDAGLLEETLEDTGTHITGTTLAGDAVRIPYRMHGGTVSTEINPKAVLDLPMQENDARAKTIRQYLAKLAESVWLNDEGFDGKRPFGNSGWWTDLYAPLVTAGLVKGGMDAYGDFNEEFDENGARALITAAVRAMGKADSTPAEAVQA